MTPVLYAVACAAPPTRHITSLITTAQAAGWDICLITTPTAATWLADELPQLATLSGHPVRSTYKQPTEPDVLPAANAILVAPATFNTINKWAAGISDTLALGLINEAIGLGIPITAVPYINDALSAHPTLATSINTLRGAGITIIDLDPRPTPDAIPWADLLPARP